MCSHFDLAVSRACREDDAEEVVEKERLNFCEWYIPAASTFDPQQAAAEFRAHNELEALFSDEEVVRNDDNAASQDAEDLFK